MSSTEKRTEFEEGFDKIFQTFKKYARGGVEGGSDDKLEKDEMRRLVKEEFKGYLGICDDLSVDKIFEEFDEDKSDSVDFVEFLKIVAKLAQNAKIVDRLAEDNRKK
ncbi:protein S100-A7-like [Styela clava]|uniref:protein S100-A7-like n=1 Tax=Styela clava TaxID=7725 RepID=UPI0019396AF9|nr:protein S100-A7-like [Styela clava]